MNQPAVTNSTIDATAAEQRPAPLRTRARLVVHHTTHHAAHLSGHLSYLVALDVTARLIGEHSSILLSLLAIH